MNRLILLAFAAVACVPTMANIETGLDAQSVIPSDCQAVANATEVEDDRFEAVRKINGPLIRRFSSRPRHFYYVSDSGSAYGPVLVVTWYVDNRPSSYIATAFGVGGVELEVLDTDVEYQSRSLGYTVTALIGLSEEVIEWIVESGSLEMRVSISYHEIELLIPANYFLGISQKASLGWGTCQPNPPTNPNREAPAGSPDLAQVWGSGKWSRTPDVPG